MLINSTFKPWLIRKDNIRLWSCIVTNVKQKLNINDKNWSCFIINMRQKLNVNYKSLKCFDINMRQMLNVNNNSLKCFNINMRQMLNMNNKNLRYFVINWSWSRTLQFNKSRNRNILMICIRNMVLNQLNSMQRTKQEIRLTMILIMMLLFPLFKNPFLQISQMSHLLNPHPHPHTVATTFSRWQALS